MAHNPFVDDLRDALAKPNSLMSPTCTNLGHRVGTPGKVVRDTARATYHDLTCPDCGKSQGVRRVVK